MTKLNGRVIIREFKKEDFNEIAPLIVEAFESKFLSMTNLSREEVVELFLDVDKIENIEFQDSYVAEKNGKILGIISLKWRGQKKPEKTKTKGYMKIFKKYGFMNMMKLMIGMSILANESGKGECYIEHIAVSSEARGMGIGTMLLDKAKEFVDEREELNRLTLHVAMTNERAFKLYSKSGFEEKSRQNSYVTKMLLNEKGFIYMCNERNRRYR